ncbi:uncharacterized protein LAESUDRAFT_716744 [Laetiporus sulphureus 93-53]|uniref:Uncharacterized protein n=1 Tax=Laetiporus sulphureus 93-53 TaxID=1314785 RepID=A0A165CGE8_9APHY|nr:uncharacterized protein LAESUDRAFT_716744 [Laetiporus sulphureus 93-53]KZT02762.1 hypothetical protein LAESUDRAFT_716744 [Laetiporus sulphureus 93-53]
MTHSANLHAAPSAEDEGDNVEKEVNFLSSEEDNTEDSDSHRETQEDGSTTIVLSNADDDDDSNVIILKDIESLKLSLHFAAGHMSGKEQQVMVERTQGGRDSSHTDVDEGWVFKVPKNVRLTDRPFDEAEHPSNEKGEVNVDLLCAKFAHYIVDPELELRQMQEY